MLARRLRLKNTVYTTEPELLRAVQAEVPGTTSIRLHFDRAFKMAAILCRNELNQTLHRFVVPTVPHV